MIMPAAAIIATGGLKRLRRSKGCVPAVIETDEYIMKFFVKSGLKLKKKTT